MQALAAANVDDAVRVGVLGQRLRNDRLATPEGAGDGARACPEQQCPYQDGAVDRGLSFNVCACRARGERPGAGQLSTGEPNTQLSSRQPCNLKHHLHAHHDCNCGLLRNHTATSPNAHLSGRKPSPPRTEGKRASSTRCPVSSGVLASSFAATGRGDRTGHVCSILYFCAAADEDRSVGATGTSRSTDCQ